MNTMIYGVIALSVMAMLCVIAYIIGAEIKAELGDIITEELEDLDHRDHMSGSV